MATTLEETGARGTPSGRRINLIALGLTLLACAAAAVGGVLAAGMVSSGRQARALQQDASVALKGPAAIGQDVPTSFGVVAVQSMARSAGPTAKALAGVTHGIQSLVPPNKVEINATTTITNLQPTVLRYSPAQFSLYATRGSKPGAADKPIRVSRASAGAGTLQPDASVDLTLSFVAPRDGSKLWIAFRDPANETPVLVDLGRTDRTPRGALGQYHTHGR